MSDDELKTIVQMVLESLQSNAVRSAIEREVVRALDAMSTQSRVDRGKRHTAMTKRGRKRKTLVIEPRYPVDGNATAKEAAEFLKITRYMVYEMVKEGRLPKLDLGMTRIVIPWKSLHELATPAKAPAQIRSANGRARE